MSTKDSLPCILNDAPTVIKANGLSYESKGVGSPITGDSRSMSCFLCGAFRPSALMKSRLFVGKYHKVCSPRCEKG